MKIAAFYILNNKPYFGYEFFAQQGVLDRHKYFLPLIEYYKDKTEYNKKISILEIGSYAGASAITFADGCKQLSLDCSIICVDMWEPYFDKSIDNKDVYLKMNNALENNLILNLFVHNIKSSGYNDKISYKRGNSTKVLPSLPEKSFDIIYIDGCHTFDVATEDINNAKKLIKDGGIICGDDLEVLKKDILDIERHNKLVESNQDYASITLTNNTIEEYHPGVAEAVDLHFNSISLLNGFWAVQYLDGEYKEIVLNLNDLTLPFHLEDFQREDTIKVEREKNINLVESIYEYNIVSVNDLFVAVNQNLGEIDFNNDFFTRQELPPYIMNSTSLTRIKEKIKQVSKK